MVLGNLENLKERFFAPTASRKYHGSYMLCLLFLDCDVVFSTAERLNIY